MKQHFFDNPRNTKRVVQALTACCAALFLLDAFIHRHTSHSWEEVFGFYPLYGFISCVVLVLIAREIRKLVMRSDRYYADNPQDKHTAPEEDKND